MQENLLARINSEIVNYWTKLIQVVPLLWYNQYEIINQIFFFNNSKFQTGEWDPEGDKKYFFNINVGPRRSFKKGIDFDTADIKLMTAGGGDPMKTWYMQRDLAYWMRDKQFGKVLNGIFDRLGDFGSCVLKIVNGVPMFVDLRQFVVEQTADTLNDSNYITEIHNYTVVDFKKVAKKMGWDILVGKDGKNIVKKVVDEFRKMPNTAHIRLLERYGELENEDGTFDYYKLYMADVGINELTQYGTLVPYSGIELNREVVESHPYWEFHINKIPGRWLGVGVTEQLFEPQIRENELANLASKGTYLKALTLFQGADDSFAGSNLLADHSNGDYLANKGSPISQIDVTDKNLAFFNEEFARWNGNISEMSFSYNVNKGGTLPSRSSLINSYMQLTNELAWYAQIKQEIALDVKEMLYEVILPQFEKDNTPEHILRITGEDLNKVQDLMVDEQAHETLFNQISNGKLPTQDEFDLIKTALVLGIKQGKELLLTIPKNFYKGIKYDIDINITGESINAEQYAADLQTAIQAVTNNPNLLQDPQQRKFFARWLEAKGINAEDLLDNEPKNQIQQQLQQPQSMGGGVGNPQMRQMPIPGNMPATI